MPNKLKNASVVSLPDQYYYRTPLTLRQCHHPEHFPCRKTPALACVFHNPCQTPNQNPAVRPLLHLFYAPVNRPRWRLCADGLRIVAPLAWRADWVRTIRWAVRLRDALWERGDAR